MTIKAWAKKLSGIEYPANELDGDYQRQLKEDGIIAIFGMSDDLMEFRGVIYDEVGAWEGTEALISSREKGTAFVFCEEENQDSAEFNRKQIGRMHKVKAVWCPRGEDGEVCASWEIETALPHEKFDIMEGGELYCRGVLIHVDSVEVPF